MQIYNESENVINLGNVESAILHVFAPNSEVNMALRSLHESSYIHCKQLNILVTDDFFEANILRFKDEQITSELDTLEEVLQLGPKPNLYVEAHNSINV